MPKKSKTNGPLLVNIGELPVKTDRKVIIHMDKKQWEQTQKRAVEVKSLPKKGVLLQFIPDPEGGGIGFLSCPEQGPDNICMAKIDPLSGSTSCLCKPKKPSVGPPGLGSVPQKCKLEIKNGTITCGQGTCTGRCRLVFVRRQLPGRLAAFSLACECAS